MGEGDSSCQLFSHLNGGIEVVYVGAVSHVAIFKETMIGGRECEKSALINTTTALDDGQTPFYIVCVCVCE